MKYLAVEIRTQTATFRNPDFQNFHKTLMLPPPTTIVGIAGAALGLNPQAAQQYFENNAWQFGVYGSSMGKAKDLWKYRTLNEEKPTSIILKEILIKNEFVLVFGCALEGKLVELQTAFLQPQYALSMGSSDSVAKVVRAEIISEVSHNRELSHCLVEGNVIAEVLSNVESNPIFSIYTTSDPIAYALPTRFSYTSAYGVRRVVARKEFSFIGESMLLNVQKSGIKYQDKFIPVFDY